MSDIDGESSVPSRPARDSKKPMIIIGVALVALLAVGIGVYAFFAGDDIPAPELDTATKQAVIDAAKEGDATTTTEGQSAESTLVPSDDQGTADVDGTWSISPSSDEVNFDEEPTGSYVQFRVQEELASIGSTDAVGRTHGVTGEITIDGAEIAEASFEAEMGSIKTDRSQRDGRVQSALDTDQFPTASFKLTEPIELDEAAIEGEEFVTEAVGDLTIHGVTKEVTIDIEAQLDDGLIIVVGSTAITFEDFDVEVPSSSSVISVSDDATIEVLLVFKQN